MGEDGRLKILGFDPSSTRNMGVASALLDPHSLELSEVSAHVIVCPHTLPRFNNTDYSKEAMRLAHGELRRLIYTFFLQETVKIIQEFEPAVIVFERCVSFNPHASNLFEHVSASQCLITVSNDQESWLYAVSPAAIQSVYGRKTAVWRVMKERYPLLFTCQDEQQHAADALACIEVFARKFSILSESMQEAQLIIDKYTFERKVKNAKSPKRKKQKHIQ